MMELPKKNRRGCYTSKGVGRRVPSYISIEGIPIPLNVREYYRIQCAARGCSRHSDGSHYETKRQFVRRTMEAGWMFSSQGDFYCPTHTLEAYEERKPQ